MRKKIAIIGCGQLGSRHLQAVAKLEGPLKIQVVEPISDNQRIGKMRVTEVLRDDQDVEIQWFPGLDALDEIPDVTIIATTAAGRASILIQLAERGHQRFLVEKMVCQSREEYDRIGDAFAPRPVKGWVDCTRRYFPFYERMIPLLEKEKILVFQVTAGNHGLGSNAIHLLDLFWRMVGSPGDLKMNGDGLVPFLLPNPRGSDLVEFAGTITASTPFGSFASISFHPGHQAPVLVQITSDHYRVSVNESDDKAHLARQETNWQWEALEFQTLYSSNLTTAIVGSIMKEDSCLLPTIQDSYLLHDELFRIFNQHIQRVGGNIPALCPIT